MNIIRTWEDADAAMAALFCVATELRVAVANRDNEIANVTNKCEPQLGTLCKKQAALESALTKFAKAHKREFRARDEGGACRSYEHAGVEIGFRTDPPRVRIESEEDATAWLAKTFGEEYIRRAIEPNREALLDALKDDANAVTEKMAAHGITMQQKDRVFVRVL